MSDRSQKCANSLTYLLLQIIDRHVFQVNLLGTVNVGSVSKNADRHARTGNVRKPSSNTRKVVSSLLFKLTRKENILDGTRETLVSLRVVVLETNLKLNGLNEIPLLLAIICLRQQFLDGAPHRAYRQFAAATRI